MRRYLVLTSLVAFFAILSTISLNWVVDPYGVFGMPDLAEINVVKPRAGQRGWLAKVYRIQQTRPKALILGNSRAEVGFDPEHTDWPVAMRPVVNAALPGTGPSTARDLFALALRTSNPQLVVLGLDFLDFRTAPDASPEAPPSAPDPFEPSRQLRDYRDVLISSSALRDSIVTVLAQRDPYSRDLTRLGFNPMRDHVRIAKSEGYEVLFAQKDLDNVRNYTRGPKSIFVSGTKMSDAFSSLRQILEVAHAGNVDLRLVIYPYHARILELFHATGLWPAFEDWKRSLVLSVERHRATHPMARVTLWDFSGYSAITSEAVPPGRLARGDMRWYWEAGHFKKSTGDRVLKQVLAASHTGDGVILTSSNVETEIERIHIERQRYLAMRADEAAAMRMLALRTEPPKSHGDSDPPNPQMKGTK